ncbi:efflux RND transporter permease subunit [Vibrio salinus]|uniref:efflux RND transporter permease subunit n=1 Tax=Vibrio salinus TaxID=2899784 RepID=UPI001E4F0D8B|nr:MMPL family transporter [Vibrio salinus]MCE0493286.1 MMPL family transporter [Vibrio salinus]
MDIKDKNHSSYLDTWIVKTVRYPILSIILILTLIVLASIGAKDLTFRGDYNIFFDKGNPQLLEFNHIQAEFSKTDNLAIIIAPRNKNVFTPQTLSIIQKITNDAWQTPYSSRVDSLTNYQHTESVRNEEENEDDLIVQDLVPDEFSFSEQAIQKIKQIALSEPVTKNSIVSAKGDVAVVNITVQLPEKNKTTEIVEVYDYVTNLLSKYQKQYPDTEFYRAGLVAMNYSLMDSAHQDIIKLVPMMLVVILMFLILLLRSFLSVLATLVVIITSVSATLGISGWLGMSINVATVNIPTLILTLSVADCVHIISTMRHQMLNGENKSQAIIHSLKIDVMPVLITSVTTAIGFLMMNMSDSPVLRTFGTLAGLGVMLACILSLTLLPTLLCLLPIKAESPAENKKTNRIDYLSNFIIKYRKFLLPVSVIVIISTAILIPQNRINDDSVKYFNKGSDFRQVADFMQDHISGMGTISVVINSSREHGIVDPDFLKTVENFTRWLRKQPEVDHVSSLTDILKRLNKNMHGDDRSFYRLPDNRELAAQYLLMYEMSLPYGLDLNNQINIDKSALKIQVTTENLGSDKFIDLENRIHSWFNHNNINGKVHEIKESSPSLMFAHIGATNMKSMLISLPISLIIISGLLVLALNSFKLGLFSIIPNMAPAIIGFGLWALISGEINLALSVVASLTLGIVVDDCVHFLTKYRIARIKGESPENAIRYSFHSVGRALWVTSVVLVAGFSVLAMSSFRLNSDMGKLSSIIIFLALIIDFFFLPCLLMMFDKDKKKKVSV